MPIPTKNDMMQSLIKDETVDFISKDKLNAIETGNPYEAVNKDIGFIIGQKVKAKGKVGVIIDISDKIKVKFDNGEVVFLDTSQIEPIVIDTRLKSFNKSAKCDECGKVVRNEDEMYNDGSDELCENCMEERKRARDRTSKPVKKSFCPFCKSPAFEVKTESKEHIYSCIRCNERFINN
jgi:hypothetical protein